MAHLNLAVSTQTPLLRFDANGASPAPAGGGLPPHRLSPGGVCRMVLPTPAAVDAAASPAAL